MKIKSKKFTALVIRRKQPFADWLKDADNRAGSDSDYEFPGDYGTYLIKGVNTATEVENFVRNHYKELFENELAEWHEPTFWPEEISYELFCRWFEVEVHRQVYRVR